MIVNFFNAPCGELLVEQGRYSFRYLNSYLASRGPAISVSMPLRDEAYGDEIAFPFFENLLPEGELRNLLAERLGTAANNFSRLLLATGGDLAGAISIQPEEDRDDHEARQEEPEGGSECLSEVELGRVLKRIETTPFLAGGDANHRLSLAGAQNKLPVVIEETKVYLATAQRISTHIIKPPARRFPALVENEAICMSAARQVGIDCPVVRLLPFRNEDGEQLDCYAIARYDRSVGPAGVERIHQEDVCQILGVPSALKYETDGGPGYAQLFDCVRAVSMPSAIYQNELLRRILFNLLIGNNDAHGKNFSFLHRSTRVQLAPAYDLVCTEVYEGLNQQFAMRFGEARQVDELDKSSIRQFEQQAGISLMRQSGQLLAFLEESLSALHREAQRIREDAYQQEQKVIDRMRAVFDRNQARLSTLLKT